MLTRSERWSTVALVSCLPLFNILGASDANEAMYIAIDESLTAKAMTMVVKTEAKRWIFDHTTYSENLIIRLGMV